MKKLTAILLLLLFVFAPVFSDPPDVEESDTETILQGDLSESKESEAQEEGSTKSRPTVALVLSGGGAKGIRPHPHHRGA